MECEQLKLFIEDIELYEANPACEDTKVCSKCNHTLPVTDFSPVGKGGYVRHECRSCAYELNRVRTGLKKLHGQHLRGMNVLCAYVMKRGLQVVGLVTLLGFLTMIMRQMISEGGYAIGATEH